MQDTGAAVNLRYERVGLVYRRLAESLPPEQATESPAHSWGLHWAPACKDWVDKACGYPRNRS